MPFSARSSFCTKSIPMSRFNFRSGCWQAMKNRWAKTSTHGAVEGGSTTAHGEARSSGRRAKGGAATRRVVLLGLQLGDPGGVRKLRDMQNFGVLPWRSPMELQACLCIQSYYDSACRFR